MMWNTNIRLAFLRSLLALPFTLLIRAYRLVSPLKQLILGPYARCRFHPTCSEYALECFQRFHLIKAIYLSLARISRCNLFIPEGMIRSFARKLSLNAMNPELTDPPPSFCDESTDLLPFFKQATERAVLSREPLFVSVTIETSYSDPLAILEEIHQADEPICYLEKPSNEFSIACAEFVAEASFDGSNRFEQAKIWGNSIFNRTIVAGDHINPGTGPTLFHGRDF